MNRHYEKLADGTVKCIEDEVPFEVPQGWCWCRLESLFNMQAGKNITSLDISVLKTSKNIYPCFGGNGIRGFVPNYNNEGTFPIMGRQGALCGNINIAFGKFYATEHAVVIDNFGITDILWAYYFLIGLNLNQYATATAQPGLSIAKILKTYIPLPPLSEQKRIVKQIEKLKPFIEKYDKNEKVLEQFEKTFPELLKKSILQYAIQGKLVLQNLNDEPASELLKRIRIEKERLIKDKKIKRDKVDSLIFKGDDNKYYERIGKITVCIDEEIPFEIPESWEWCRLRAISIVIHYGYTASAAESGNCKLLRITDIQNNNVNWETVPYCTVNDKELSTYELHDRDILIARTGGTIGKSFIINNVKEKSVFASYLIRVVLSENIDENYIKLFIESPFYWKQLTSLSMGTGQPNVNGQSLSSLLVALPPLEEQKIVVKEIGLFLNKINLLNLCM